MNLEAAREQARLGKLYPGVILHGGAPERRFEVALDLARTLLCEAVPAERPCGECRHCRRIRDPDASDLFHPDFVVLSRDLKTSTSVDAVKNMLRTAQVSPFEARGQVFVLRSAESLTGGAANALLKNLEEPALSAPRHFLLLTPSAIDLLPTLRSRSLSIYLGQTGAGTSEVAADVGERVARMLAEYLRSGAPVLVLSIARALADLGPPNDPRDSTAFVNAARVLVELSRRDLPAAARRALLALAEELMMATELRLRGIQAPTHLRGAHLAPSGGPGARRGRCGAAPFCVTLGRLASLRRGSSCHPRARCGHPPTPRRRPRITSHSGDRPHV